MSSVTPVYILVLRMTERRRAEHTLTAQRELELLGLTTQAEAMIQTVSDSGLAVFTLRQIGDLLGVNESRISQIHKTALKKMAVVLQSEGIHSAEAI